MKKEVQNFFAENYDKRFYNLLAIQLIILLLYRLFTLLTTTQSITGISFFTPSENALGFSILEIALTILFVIKIPGEVIKQDLFTFLIAIDIFFVVLYVEQYYLPDNPIILESNDLIFVILQLIILIILLLAFRKEIGSNKKSIREILILSFAFFLILIGKLIGTDYNLTNLFLFLGILLFWVLLWSYIVQSTKNLYTKYKWKAFLPIVISIFLVIGMYMGMTKSLGGELAKTVFNTIINQTFSLYSINTSFYGFNPEILMIVIGLISGFTFLIVLFTELVFEKGSKNEIIMIILIGNVGLAVVPLIATIRYLAVFKYLSFNKKVNDALNTS